MKNKMGSTRVNKLIWTMGLPMVLSMVLQAVYNVVDTIFVINSNAAIQGNAALTAAFPIQILIIAIGVGTGVGINAMLSRKLGEGDKETVNRVAGNGIFLALLIYVVFLLFGLFLANPYMRFMSSDSVVIRMGTEYLQICCCFSIGAIGFTVYERFLQATGKTFYSMIAQVVGAVCNIVLDYVFVIVLGWGVAGAAWATVIGQILSLATAMVLHYSINREIDGHVRFITPSGKIIKTIYKIGVPAAVMQALLAVMMFIVLQIFKVIDDGVTMALMINAYGIYYKIMQTALFACFGLSNTLITMVSFNYGLKDKERLREIVKFGIVNSVIVSAVIFLLFQLFAVPVSELFGMSLPELSANGIAKTDILSTCETAIHIATIGYVFMSISVAIQGILQGFRNVYKPIIISFLRLIVFVVPFAVIFCLGENVTNDFWWTFVIAEILTAVCSLLLLRDSVKKM